MTEKNVKEYLRQREVNVEINLSFVQVTWEECKPVEKEVPMAVAHMDCVPIPVKSHLHIQHHHCHHHHRHHHHHQHHHHHGDIQGEIR